MNKCNNVSSNKINKNTNNVNDKNCDNSDNRRISIINKSSSDNDD